jgi:hypothetical protein
MNLLFFKKFCEIKNKKSLIYLKKPHLRILFIENLLLLIYYCFINNNFKI